jgi:hypothetical protein
MQNETIETPAEADVRFLSYRLEVISQWDPSPRKEAAAEAIAQRLTTMARTALAVSDNSDLLYLSCQLLDDFFEADHPLPPQLPSTENASNTLPGIPPLVAYPDSTSNTPPPIAAPGPSSEPPRAGTPLTVFCGPAVSKSHKIDPSVVE